MTFFDLLAIVAGLWMLSCDLVSIRNKRDRIAAALEKLNEESPE